MANNPPHDYTRRLTDFIHSLHGKGILDEQFDVLKSMQNEADPHFVPKAIVTFCTNADTQFAQLTIHLDIETEINYTRLANFANQLKGGSSSVGGKRVALHCGNLLDASLAEDKERCIATFKTLKEEYNTLRRALSHICELEGRSKER